MAEQEQKRWFKDARLIIPSILVPIIVVVLAALLPAIIDLFKTETRLIPPTYNRELLLDTSKAMEEPYGDSGTKWEAAKVAIPTVLMESADPDFIALREFGGSCEGSDSSVRTGKLVDWGPGNVNKKIIDDQIKAIVLEGDTTLYGGILEASADFEYLKDIKTTKEFKKQLIVITGEGVGVAIDTGVFEGDSAPITSAN